MTQNGWLAASAAIAVAGAFACSSNSSSGGGASGSACLSSMNGSNQACTSCEESNCSSELSTASSACSDFINCICPGGTYNASLVTGCASKESEGSCSSAGQALVSCEESKCQSQCNSSSSSGSGGSSGSSSGGTGEMLYACYIASGMICDLTEVASSELSTAESECMMQENGTPSLTCPASGLVGCCKASATGVGTCYYNASAAMYAQMTCIKVSGMAWTTTP
jgi:hypothetical protein